MKKLTLTVVILMASIISSGYAATWYVDGTNGNDANAGDSWGNAKATIQAGINAASTGDTVLVKYETNGTTCNITSSIDFGGKNIKLASDDGTHNIYEDADTNAEKCIIDAGQNCRVFYFHSGENSNAVVDGFTIQNGNSGTGNGGGIFCLSFNVDTEPTIQNNIITGNSAHDGGGICSKGWSRIQNNIITNNSASWYGGGIWCGDNSIPTVQNNTISDNWAGRCGGGIYAHTMDYRGTIQSNIISGNSANSKGGGIYCVLEGPTIVNNTITENTAMTGGGIYCSSSNPMVTNTILWGNGTEIYLFNSSIAVTHSDVQGGYTGVGNINADPQFVSTTPGFEDYHLQNSSPCISTGTASGAPTTDIEGNPRPNPSGSNPDIGAYENQYGALLPTVTNSTGVSDITTNSATLNGEVISTSADNPTVHIYWGDTDGGTTVDNWENDINLGAKGAETFSAQITNLTSNTTYYYRCYVINSAGESWADSTQTFTTLIATPTVTNSTGASNVTATSATLNGEVTSAGGDNPTVHIYWGDNDGGTTAGSWDYDVDLGTKGAETFYIDVSSLSPHTTYYYRCYAINSVGGSWADSTQTFTTLVTTPTVTNSTGALDISATSARLNGEITNTGGDNPTVHIYWGDNDGGTTAGSWDYDVDLGTKGAETFYIDVSSLSPHTTYYYRCYAENLVDGSWANSTETFITLTVPTVTNSGVSGVTDISAILNGEVISTGGDNPTVYIYWGGNDGETIAGNWENSVNLGTKGKETFSTEISSLTPDTTYHYRCYAENLVGGSWANSTETFTTTNIDVLYVNAGVSSSGDGTSWAQAFKTIPEAIAAATSGDTVLVKYGTYTSSITIDGKDIRLASDDGTHNTYETAATDASQCIIDGENSHRLFTFSNGETLDAVVNGFTIQNGRASVGSAIELHSSSVTIKNCIIQGNLATAYGGAILCDGKNSSVTIQNSTISGNSTLDSGGGGIILLNCWTSTSTIQNCIISENYAYGSGGGIRTSNSKLTIVNSTITGNSTGANGGGIFSDSILPTITNTILWNNGSETAGGATVTYSCVQGGYTGEGNINADPLFVNAAAGDYNLQDASPCIDKGTSSDAPATDIEGNPRDAHPDIGAYEYIPALPSVDFTASSQSVTEYVGTVTVSATLSAASDQEVTVSCTFGGSATGGGVDYNLTNGMITIPAGQTEGTVTFNVIDDDMDEYDETVIINMSTTTNAVLGSTTTHTVTITEDSNDPPPTVNWTMASQSVVEGDAVTITAALNTVSGKEITVSYTVGGSAAPGADHNLTDGAITISAGQTMDTQTFNVVADGDDQEPDETVIINMGTTPTNATAGTITTHTVNIALDSDGVSTEEEQGPPDNPDPNYDGNGDGTPDCEQNNVASLNTHNDAYYVTLANEGEENPQPLANVQAIENPSSGELPADADFPYGFFEFAVKNVEVGGATNVTIYLHGGVSPKTYYKYGPTPDNTTPHWYEFMRDGQTGPGAVITEDDITLYFVDGLRGDDDLTPNGTVVDAGGPGFIGSLSPVASSLQTAGESFTVDIQAEDVIDIFGVSFELTYNTTYLTATAVSYESNLLGSDLVTAENIDDASGIVGIGVSRKSGAGGVNGIGMVAHVTFTSTAQGGSFSQSITFGLQTLDAIDSNGDSVSMDLGSASVTLEGTAPSDTTPPTPNTIASVVAASATQIDVTSTEATDDTLPVFYRLGGQYYDGSAWGDSGGGVSDYDYLTTRPNPWSDTSLVENGLYHYRQKVKDSATSANESAWSNWVEKATLLNPPDDTEITFANVTTTGMNVTVATPPKPSGAGSTGAYFDLITGEGQGSGASDRDYADDYTAEYTNLNPNTQYGWKAKYRNYDGVETAYNSTEQKKYTLANTPSAPTVSNPTSTMLDVTINPNGNPGHTLFAIYSVTGSCYVNSTGGSNGANEVWQTQGNWGSVTVVELTPGTTYEFKCKAKNGDSIVTSLGASGSGTTLTTPTVASATPNALGQGASNKDVVIAGTNFQNGASVTFSNTGVTVNSTQVDSSTQITVNVSVASDAPTGSRDITVTNPDSQSGTGTGIFTVNPAPTITSLSPSQLPQGTTNQDVTIAGNNFQNGASVSFSGTGITVNSTTFVSATEITANISIEATAASGNRNVTVTNPDYGVGTKTGGFTVITALVVDAGEDKTICHPNNGGSVQIGGNPTASGGTSTYTYNWSPAGSLDDASIANPTATPTTTTTYTVTVTDSSNLQQQESDTVAVTVYPELIANAGEDKEINSGESVQIGGNPTASGGASPYQYSWTPADTLDNPNSANPNATPTETTTYTVTVTDANGCVDTDDVTVTISPLTTITISDVRISNYQNSEITITWWTDIQSDTKVHYGTTTNLGQTAIGNDNATLHHVTITGLTAETPYYFSVQSGNTIDDNQGSFYQFTTTKIPSSPNPFHTVYGFVYKDYAKTQPAVGALVFLTVTNDTGTSYPLSYITGDNGDWALDLTSLKNPNTNDNFSYVAGDAIHVEVYDDTNDTSGSATVGTSGQTQFPDMILTSIQEQTLNLKAGLNSIAFPLQMTESYTAKNWLPTVTGATKIYNLRPGGGFEFAFKIPGTSIITGTDFDILADRGYIVQVDQDSDYIVSGYPYAAPLPLSLKAGLNAIAIPYSSVAYTSKGLIPAIISAVKVYNLRPGGGFEFAFKIPGTSIITGTNFDILANRGYIVQVEQDINFTPGEVSPAPPAIAIIHSRVGENMSERIQSSPRVSDIHTHSATISWLGTMQSLRYGTSPHQLDKVVRDDGISHLVHLEGLQPWITYFYAVGNQTGNFQTLSEERLMFDFHTLAGEIQLPDGGLAPDGTLVYVQVGESRLVSQTASGIWSVDLVNLPSNWQVGEKAVVEAYSTGRAKKKVLLSSSDIQWAPPIRLKSVDDLTPVHGEGKFALLRNYPNPFNPDTWIPFELANDSFITLRIYDVQGRLVRRLDLGHRAAGCYYSQEQAARWDGINETGEFVATGLYFYTLQAGKYIATRRMLLLK